MKIKIPTREAPLDTAAGGDKDLLLEHIQTLGTADLRALKLIYNECFSLLESAKTYEALAAHEWEVFTAVNDRIAHVVRATITHDLAEDPAPVESLHAKLGDVFVQFRTYTRGDFESFLEPPDDAEDRLFSELYAAKLDVDSDDSDEDEEEGARPYRARTTQAKAARRGTRKRPTTARKYDAYDPAYGAVKINMARAHDTEGALYCNAFKEGAGDTLASLGADDEALAPYFAVAKDARDPQKKKTDVKSSTKIAAVFKNLWDKARWNKYVDENACIYHLPGTWTPTLEKELEKVNKALSAGVDPGESSFVVAQYRGIAYNTRAFEAVGRRRSREAFELRLPVYCSAVFNAVGMSAGDYYAGVLEDGSEQSEKTKAALQEAADLMKKALAAKRTTGPFTYDGTTYDSVALALQNYYTINYEGFFASARGAVEARKSVEVADDRTALALQQREAEEALEKLGEHREQWSELETRDKALETSAKAAAERKKSADLAKGKAQGTLTAKSKAKQDDKVVLQIKQLQGEITTQEAASLKAEQEIDAITVEREELAKAKALMEPQKLEWERLEAIIADRKKRRRALDDRVIFDNLPNGGNPLVSTGNVPKHALRYAYALKYYTSADGQARLMPEWRDDDGRARHPYAGKVYVSLHPASDYRTEDGPLDVVALRTAGKLEVDDNIVAERESSFPALIPAKRVVAEHIARYPSFATKYKRVFADKYGMTEADYESFRKMQRLITGITTRDKFFEAVGEWLARYHEARLVELARRLAAREGKILVYRDENGLLSRHLSAIKKMDVKATRRSSADADGASATLDGTTARDGRHDEERAQLDLPPAEPHPAVPILGIQNTWNQCYLNSTLQLLSALSVRDNLILPGEPCIPALALCVDTFLDRLTTDAAAGTYIRESALVERTQTRHTLQNTEYLRVLLATKGRWGTIDRQEDAGEALSFCLEALSSRRTLEQFNHSPAGLANHVRLGTFLAGRPSQLHFLVRVTTTYTIVGEGLEANPGLESWYELDADHRISRLECQSTIQLAVPPDPVVAEPLAPEESATGGTTPKKTTGVEPAAEKPLLPEQEIVLGSSSEREKIDVLVPEVLVEVPLTLEALLAEHWDRAYDGGEGDITNNCIVEGRYYPAAPRQRETLAFEGEAPRHLVVQLKRFTDHLVKIKRKVVVGDEVDMGGQRYTLRAFIHHVGDSMRGGHYIAYALRGDHWYKLNDKIVTEDPAGRAEAASEAYIYYFSR